MLCGELISVVVINVGKVGRGEKSGISVVDINCVLEAIGEELAEIRVIEGVLVIGGLELCVVVIGEKGKEIVESWSVEVICTDVCVLGWVVEIEDSTVELKVDVTALVL